jgi:uncharacterized protein YndB with AHSA1/START domain
MNREAGVITREVFIAAPLETVFEFLVDAQVMARWIGSFEQIDPQPGGIFQIEVSPGNVARGKYTEVVPFRRVAFTWGWLSQDPELAALRPGASLVEIELEPKDGGTLLRLHHSGLPDGLESIHAERWSVYLARLAAIGRARADDAGSYRMPIRGNRDQEGNLSD